MRSTAQDLSEALDRSGGAIINAAPSLCLRLFVTEREQTSNMSGFVDEVDELEALFHSGDLDMPNYLPFQRA